jgi:hypothetical protein
MPKFSGNNARLLRRILRLAEYDFTVQYRPGTKFQNFHTLSRHISTLSSNETQSKERVKQKQASKSQPIIETNAPELQFLVL